MIPIRGLRTSYVEPQPYALTGFPQLRLVEKPPEPREPRKPPKVPRVLNKWTPEEDARLRTLWAGEMLARNIALEISRTKDAVIGRAYRLGLARRDDPSWKRRQ